MWRPFVPQAKARLVGISDFGLEEGFFGVVHVARRWSLFAFGMREGESLWNIARRMSGKVVRMWKQRDQRTSDGQYRMNGRTDGRTDGAIIPEQY